MTTESSKEESSIKDGTPRESWLDYSASQIPFPNKQKAREFLSEVTEGWGFAAIALEAKGKRGYVLLDPRHFEKLLNLWRHVWDDPLGRQTKVIFEPGSKNMAYIEVNKTSKVWTQIFSGVAILIIFAVIASEIHSFANEKVQDKAISNIEKDIQELNVRVKILEGGNHPL